MDKPVIPRTRAREDVDAAIDYYADEAGADIAFAFVDALEDAYAFIGAAPAARGRHAGHTSLTCQA